MSHPRFTIIAGANGAGKSTLTRNSREAFLGIDFLDPDTVARELLDSRGIASPIEAGRIVLEAAGRHIANRDSFAVETTLSG